MEKNNFYAIGTCSICLPFLWIHNSNRFWTDRVVLSINCGSRRIWLNAAVIFFLVWSKSFFLDYFFFRLKWKWIQKILDVLVHQKCIFNIWWSNLFATIIIIIIDQRFELVVHKRYLWQFPIEKNLMVSDLENEQAIVLLHLHDPVVQSNDFQTNGLQIVLLHDKSVELLKIPLLFYYYNFQKFLR